MRGSRPTDRISRRGSALGSSQRRRRAAVRPGVFGPLLCSRSWRSSSWPRSPVPSPSACPASGSSSATRAARPPPAVATPAPSPTGSVPPAGSSLDLGDRVDPAAAEERVHFPVLLPTDPALGAPDAAYVSERDEVALVWGPRDDLPPTVESDIGLLIMQFRGSVSPEPIGKIIGSGTSRRAGPHRRWIRLLDHRQSACLLLHDARRGTRRRGSPLGRRRPDLAARRP